MSLLQFQPLQSVVDVTFWSELGDLKLHRLKLEEGPVALRAHLATNNHPEFPGFLTVEPSCICASQDEAVAQVAGEAGGPQQSSAAGAGGGSKPGQVVVRGDLFCLNTVESLTKFERKAAVQKVAQAVWSSIVSGAAEEDPSLLQRLLLLTYCDLKHYKYYYWFAFPALQPPSPYTAAPAVSVAAHFLEGAEQVLEACEGYAAAHPGTPCWLVACSRTGASVLPLTDWSKVQSKAQSKAQAQAPGQGGAEEICLAVADCSNLPGNPGWPLRNILLMAAARWRVRSLTVVCLRERRGRYDAAASIVLQVSLPEVGEDYCSEAVGGWEANTRGKPGPRMADLGPSMDPQRLAASAVDLNLRLMRWRAAPTLQVDQLAKTKCLLLGAGTLGCSVARTLLGWGVRHITFVDNSRVAYSNPVRQSLYNFEDCLAGGKPKAQAAAEAVQRIFPGVRSEGVTLCIPMPGHPISPAEKDKVLQDISLLEDLVSQHDVIFLLTDTRESRWLPTLLAAAGGKLAINSALGFDGFMVMRHGAGLPGGTAERGGVGGGGLAVQQQQQEQQETAVQQQETAVQQQEMAVQQQEGAVQGEQGLGQGQRQEQRQEGEQGKAGAAEGRRERAEGSQDRLGCYFCNDVVAPINSTMDRTLDQQCTVARPGLSAIAGALAVELMAATLSHPMGPAAPAAGTPSSKRVAEAEREAGGELALGEVPHMIRGQLGGFSQMCLSGQAFRQCTACSEAVVERYREEGHDFLLKGLEDPKFLEDLTGLTELHKASEAAVEGWDSEEDGEEEEATEGPGQEGGGDRDAWEEL